MIIPWHTLKSHVFPRYTRYTHLLIYSLTLLGSYAFAHKQILTLDDNKIIKAYGAKEGLTRVMIQGDRIQQVMGTDDLQNIEKDEQRGILFLKGLTQKQTLALLTENGHFQELELTPMDKPSAHIVLKPSDVKEDHTCEKSISRSVNKKTQRDFLYASSMKDQRPYSLTYQQSLIHIMHRLYGYESTPFAPSAPKLPSVQGTWIKHDDSLKEGSYVGHVYTLKNTTQALKTFQEGDFYTKGILAIAIEENTLKPKQTTRLFVVTLENAEH